MTDNRSLGQILTHMLTELEKDLPEESTARHLLYSHRVKIREAFDAAASAVWDKAVEECAKQIGEDPALTDSLAAVIEAVAKDGLPHPRDTDVAIDAIRESAKMVLRSLKRSDKTESRN